MINKLLGKRGAHLHYFSGYSEHPINRFLSLFSLRLSKSPPGFYSQYESHMKRLEGDRRGFGIVKGRYHYPNPDHPKGYVDCECEFTAHHVSRLNPDRILDIGSYRHFILGMLATRKLTTLDIRSRRSELVNESIITGDATNIDFPDESFDAIVSLCSLEHFGLGAYGDKMDIYGDIKGFEEMKRLLAPGGSIIYTTTLTRAKPHIFYNAHRVYDYKMVHGFHEGLELTEERFYSHKKGDFCRLEEITNKVGEWDVYLACLKKATR